MSNLLFGGNTGLPRNSNTVTGELQNQLSWISLDNKHRYKFGVDFRYNRYSQDNTTNRYGTFIYNSLSDFQNGIPASFSRRLQVNRRLGDDLGVSAGWAMRIVRTQRLQLTYGLRVDASHFQGNPAFNPRVDSIFGARNDAVPRGVYVSPRLGFSWTYGTNPQVGGFEGAQRGSRGQISGGIGQFQNLPNSQLIAAAVDQTGLPSAAQQLSCIGSAVPVAGLERLSVEHRQHPDDLRRRHHVVLEHRAERHAVRAGLHPAAQLARATSTGTRRCSTTGSG